MTQERIESFVTGCAVVGLGLAIVVVTIIVYTARVPPLQGDRDSRRVWLTVDNGQMLVDLDAYTSVVVGATEVEFRESGFTTLRVPRSDGLVTHIKAYYGGVELSEKREVK